MKGPNEVFPFDHPTINYTHGQFASNKMDGERMLNLCGERMYSPSLKPMRNKNLDDHARGFFEFCRQHRIVTDSEIWSPIRSFHMPDKEQGIGSILAAYSRPIPDDIGIYVFDAMSEDEWDNGTERPFAQRVEDMKGALTDFNHVYLVEQHLVKSASEAQAFFENQLANGQEGMILRAPNAAYKHGRTTLNQDGMWKFKEFLTHEAVIIGVEEQMRLKEGVERTVNVIGQLERRYEQDLYEPAGMVGAFIVSWQGASFKVKPGKGHNNEMKKHYWMMRHIIIGKHCEFKYMPHGTLDKPRIGSLVRFRPDLDLA